jgi:[protein-PII] uridylyltransferase
MTPWRVEQLWRVYTMGVEQLTRELMTDRIHAAGPELSAIINSAPHMAFFLEGLPTRYLRTHTRAEIQRHFELHKLALADGVAVHVAHEAGAYVLSVVAKDQPGLFAAVCGGLASFGMSIVRAQAFSNAGGYIVDVIRFADPLRTLELNPGETDRLQWTIQCIVKGTLDVKDLLKRRRRAPIPSTGAKIAPRIRFNNDASDHSTLIDFVAEDRPGLLYDLASILSSHGCDIEVVLIDTEAHRAIDVFYVTQNGDKLPLEIQHTLHDELIGVGMKS